MEICWGFPWAVLGGVQLGCRLQVYLPKTGGLQHGAPCPRYEEEHFSGNGLWGWPPLKHGVCRYQNTDMYTHTSGHTHGRHLAREQACHRHALGESGGRGGGEREGGREGGRVLRPYRHPECTHPGVFSKSSPPGTRARIPGRNPGGGKSLELSQGNPTKKTPRSAIVTIISGRSPGRGRPLGCSQGAHKSAVATTLSPDRTQTRWTQARMVMR